MEFWLACILLLFSVMGVVLLALKMREKSCSAGYVVGLVICSVAALASAGYCLLTLFLLGGIV